MTDSRPLRGADEPALSRHALGYLEVVDRPDDEALRRYYAENYFQSERSSYRHSYSDEELACTEQKIAQRARAVEIVRGGRPVRTLLDVGCGEGFAMRFFHELGVSVRGFDFSDDGMRSMNPDMLPLLETGDVFDLVERERLGTMRHDLIWLQNVLKHVREPLKLLHSLRELITPGGVLVVTVPNDGSPLQELLFENGDIGERFWIAVPDHLSYFTPDSLRRSASATGWSCRDLLTDFAIDQFLLHPGSNYVNDRSNGAGAHRARLKVERLVGEHGHDAANAYFRSCADVGLGRNLTAFLVREDVD